MTLDYQNPIPIHDLTRAAEDSRHWHSIGPQPQFELRFEDDRPRPPGWYQIDLLIETTVEHPSARLQAVPHHDSAEPSVFALPYASRLPSSRAIHLTQETHRLLFSPHQAPGRLRLAFLGLKPLPETVAIDLMLDTIARRPIQGALKTPERWRTVLERSAQRRNLSVTARIAEEYERYFQQSFGETADYQDWIEIVETLSQPEPADAPEPNPDSPLISFLVRLQPPSEQTLSEILDAVLNQTRPHWELCILPDPGTSPATHRRLEDARRRDPRIRLLDPQTTDPLTQTSADYIGLLQPTARPAATALHHLEQTIARHPDAQILYADEDRIDADGARRDPHFKSAWNPDLFFAQDYLGPLVIYARRLLGRIDPQLSTPSHYARVLHSLPHIEPRQIVHIPRILCHVRHPDADTDDSRHAGQALRDYFDAQGLHAVRIDPGPVPSVRHVRWPLPSHRPLVSLLIPTRDRLQLLATAVHSLLDKTTYRDFEILILDNDSQEPETLEFLERIVRQETRVRVIHDPTPFNYSAINNLGVEQAHGSIVGLINNDIEVIDPDWLTEMVGHVVRPEIGCVGAKLHYSRGEIQHGGVILGLFGLAGHAHKHYPERHPGYFNRLVSTQNLSAVTAACLLVRREVYRQVGGMDADNLRIAFNDVDFCLKVSDAGYRHLWTPHARLYHHESASRGRDDTPEKRRRARREILFMQRKWGERLMNDPYYNANLTKRREDFSIMDLYE